MGRLTPLLVVADSVQSQARLRHSEETWSSLMGRSSGKVPDLTQAEVRRLLAPWNIAGQKKEVRRTLHRRSRRSAHCQIHTTSICAAPMELAEGQRIGWYSMRNVPKKTNLMEPRFLRRCITLARCRNTYPFPGCRTCHLLLGGHSDACRSRFESLWAD